MEHPLLPRLLGYTLGLRRFEDACRQLRDFDGGPGGREAFVDETLRLAMDASYAIDSLEDAVPDAVEKAQREGDEGFLDDLSLLVECLREDRARVASYSNYVVSRRIGATVHPPRRPKVVFAAESSGKETFHEEVLD